MNSKTVFSLVMGLNLGLIFLNIPPALEELMALYLASYTKISFLISALLWSHALMQVPGGILADRLGLRRSLLMSLVCMAIGNLIPAVLPNLGIAILGRVITGVGTGISFVAIMKLLALYAPHGRAGSHQAFFAGFFSIGSIFAYLFIPKIVRYGWEWTYLLPGLVCLPLVAWLMGLGLEGRTSTQPSPLPLGQIVRIRIGWIIGLYHALSYGSMINLGNWVPSLLAETVDNSTAAELVWGGALVMFISGLGRIGGGFIIMRFRALQIANGSILTLVLIFSCLFLVRAPALVLVLSLGAAWFASINFGAFFQIATKATSPDSLATLFGFINLLANSGAVLFTLMFGFVKDTAGSFSWGFAVLAMLCSIAFLIGLRGLKESTKKKSVPFASRQA